MKKSALVIVLTALLFVGCATKNYTASTTPDNVEEHNKIMDKTLKYALKATSDFYEQEATIEPNSKVFILNAHPDEVERSKAMFNYAIKLMQEKGICYEDEYEKTKKCSKPKIVLTKDGEKAEIILNTLEDNMDAHDAFRAVMQFNNKYFPGFDMLRGSGLLTATTTLDIINMSIKSGFFEYCVLDGAFEEELKEKGSVLVDDPDKADYIVLYQTLGCSERYLGHQPESLLKSIKASVSNDTVEANNSNLEAMQKHGSFGVLNGYNYGVATSVGLRTAFTPTVIGFSVLGMLGSGYTSTQGVSYEYILIDKKNEKYYGNVVEKTRRKDRYRNGMFSLVKRSADFIVK